MSKLNKVKSHNEVHLYKILQLQLLARNFKFHDSNVLPREFNANNSSLTYVRAINEKFADMFKNVKKEFELRRNLKKIAFIEHLDITVNLDKKIASVIQNVKNNLGKKAYRQRAKLKNA